MTLRFLVLLWCAWVASTAVARAQMVQTQSEPECRLARNAEIPLSFRGGHYTVPVDIGGHAYPMVLGIGTDRTAFSPDAIRMLGLTEDARQASVISGLNGARSTYPYFLPSLKFGTEEWSHLSVLPMNLPMGSPGDVTAPIGILGADVLSRYDLDIDFPNRTITLYTAQGCIAQFLPWQGRYFEYAAKSQLQANHRFVIPVTLNGRKIDAILSTGSVRTLIKRADLEQVGGTRAAQLTFAPSGPAGSSPRTVDIYRFDNLQIGPRSYRNVTLRISDSISDGEDMVLGLDFMHTRRIWFSHSSERVFMQPSSDQRKVEIPAAIIQPGVFGAIESGDTPGNDLAAMIRQHPELSTHTHMTYTPTVRVIERTRLQPPP
jgi:predicted aspartyl protease